MSQEYSLTVVVRLTAPSPSAAELAVESALDGGALQDAINGYSDACDEGDVCVTSCLASSARKRYRSCEACSGPGPCLYDPHEGGRYVCVDCHTAPDDPFFHRRA